jgi:Tfp pilus assembly protein PilN
MPAKMVSVNLLGRDELNESPIGRIISWATTYGRYIMISTEIVVLLAFISRFSLDRKLTDLNEAIDQKRTILEANLSFENDLRNIQNNLSQIKTISQNQKKPIDLLLSFKVLLPPDVYIDTFTISGTSVSVDAVAGTTNGFSIFMNNLQFMKQFTRIDVGEIKKEPLKGIVFKFTAQTEPEKQAANPATNKQNNNSKSNTNNL